MNHRVALGFPQSSTERPLESTLSHPHPPGKGYLRSPLRLGLLSPLFLKHGSSNKAWDGPIDSLSAVPIPLPAPACALPQKERRLVTIHCNSCLWLSLSILIFSSNLSIHYQSTQQSNDHIPSNNIYNSSLGQPQKSPQ